MVHLLFILLGFSSSLLWAQDAVPASFRILDVKTSGAACPPGSVALNVSSDQEAFTTTFSNFVAEIGPGIPATEKQKSCRLIFDTEHQGGW